MKGHPEMTSWTATATLARQHPGEAFADLVHGTELDAFGTVTSTDDQGRAQIVLTVDADTLHQADIITRALLARFDDLVRFEICTSDEYQADSAQAPALLSVTQAAERLGITRQAILARATRGTIPAQRIGNQWLIPETAVPAAN